MRGEAYARDGRVLDIGSASEHALIVATVRGASPYRVSIGLTWARDGSLTKVGGNCTCPVGWNCKHVAAALFAAQASGILAATGNAGAPAAPRPRPSDLPRELDHWLRQCPQEAPAKPSEDYPPTVRDRVYYLLLRSGSGIGVQPMKVGLKKDGMVGVQRRRYDFRDVRSDSAPKFVRPSDLRLFRLLRLAQGQSWSLSGPTLPAGEEGEALMQALLQTGRAYWEDIDTPPLVAADPAQGRFAWREIGAEQVLGVETESGRWLIPLPVNPPWYVDTESRACGRLETDQPDHRAAWLATAPRVAAADAGALAEAVGRVSGVAVPKPRNIVKEVLRNVTPVPVLKLGRARAKEADYAYRRWSSQVRFGKDDVAPALFVSFDYEGQTVACDDPVETVTRRAGDSLRAIARDRGRENDRIAELDLLACDCGFAHPDDLIGEVELRDCTARNLVLWPFDATDPLGPTRGGQNAVAFMKLAVPMLRDRGWRVEIDANWPCHIHDAVPQISGQVAEGDEGWFSLALNYEIAGQEVQLLPVLLRFLRNLSPSALEDDVLLEEIIAKQNFVVRLADGRYAALPMAPLAPAIRLFKDLQDRMHVAEAAVLTEVASALEGCGIAFTGGERLRDLGARLQRLSNPTTAPASPEGFQGDLRPYQAIGMGWLMALSDTGFGGVLADDMGLGKTVQTLAWLAARKAGQGGEPRPSLLIVPTSLVGTWASEAARFVPELSVLALHGPDRGADFGRIAEHDLVITTYPLLHRDHEALFAQAYDSVILDEAQAVKNPASQAAKLIREVKARQRIALSGTPLENSLEELWSLFDWLIPGLLGNRKSFNETYRRPIEKEGDLRRQQQLSRRISPFLLRRTKDQVAKDLPPKTEIVEHVVLQGQQRALYETLRVAMDQRVRTALAEKGLSGSRITVLDALLKLRQACCDPQLVKLPSAQLVTASAKRAHLMEMLEELIAERRRVLIFSQFVEMLRLIETDVKARGWEYLWLSGETQNRGDLVETFQTGRAPLFLISLKAGGVGLTLTAADTVILYDPWWNPAVERQAMDRTHRIGQHKPVFVHRLIAEGTVETRIAQMQARKQALADALFDPESTGPMTLSEEDILSLFAPDGG